MSRNFLCQESCSYTCIKLMKSFYQTNYRLKAKANSSVILIKNIKYIFQKQI